MALNHANTSRARSSSNSSSSSYHSQSERGSSMTPEITPIGQYNSKKAKLCASIRWLVSKAYSSSTIPPDIKNPFFKDKEGEDHLRPAVIYQLSSGELYSRACANIFPPSLHQWQGHWSVIQGLSRRGIYVVDDKRQPVTEAVLTQTQRIKLNAHLAVMDSIMTAFTGEVVSIEKIVQAVRRITTFNASSELPFDLENALVFWVNKVCLAERHRMERERRGQQEQLMQSQAQKVRMRRQQLQPKELPSIPFIKNVTKDISDGRSLCLLLHHYCPQLFALDDVDLHDTISFADSINNLQQVESFLEAYLAETHHFSFEDVLYCPEVLRVNILALIAELFYWFEVAKPPHLGFSQEQAPKVPSTPESSRSRVQQLPPLPISSATKKSFHGDAPMARSELRSAASNPEVNQVTDSTPRRSQSLLLHRERKPPKAIHPDHSKQGTGSLRRASSLENIEAKESVLAWSGREDDRSSVRDSNASNLLANVSIESDANDSQDFSELNTLHNLNGQMGKDGYTGQLNTSSQFDNDEDMEVESLTSALSRISQRTDPQLSNRSAKDENGCHTDQELTNVTPLSSVSSKPTESMGSEPGYRQPVGAVPGQMYDKQSEHSRTNNGEYGHFGSSETPVDMSTASRRRLKLDIQPVEAKQTERLLPAVVKPLKEKSRNMNKKEESGEGRRVGRNPREDKSDRLPNPNGGSMTSWGKKQGTSGDGESPESVDATTPMSGESIADSLAGDAMQHRLAWQRQRPGVPAHQADPSSATNSHLCQAEEPHVAHAKHGEAFFIHTVAQPEQSLGSSSSLSRTGTGSSFTIADRQYTAASARQAGIPVVSSLADLQAAEEEDLASDSHQASPRNPSPRPNLHAAPLHNPISAWHPTESLSSNPHPSPNPHAPTNPALHESSFKANALHSGGDRSAFTHAESPRGHSNTGMDSHAENIPHQHPSSPDKESSKLHADQIQRESAIGQRRPVIMTFNSNLSPDAKSSAQGFPIPSTSSLSNHSDNAPDQDMETIPSNPPVPQEEEQLQLLEAQLASNSLSISTSSFESGRDAAINLESSLITHSKPETHPMVDTEHSCMPTDPFSSTPSSQVFTTWGANSKPTPLCGIINTGGGSLNQSSNPSLTNLSHIRARLEEKRRLMDSDKRKLERHWNKQRQRVGKAAFLQVLANQKRVKEQAIEDQPIRTEEELMLAEKLKAQEAYSREEIERSIERSLEQSKSQWRGNQPQEGKITFADLGTNKEKQVPNRVADSPRHHKAAPVSQPVENSPRRPESPQTVPDTTTGRASPGSSSGSHSPHMSSDEYNTSLEKLNANLSQLQNEIQRLSLRQEQMRSAMESPRPPSERSQSPQQPPPDMKPSPLPSVTDQPDESTGFFLTSSADKEPESFVLHENPLYDLAGSDLPSPRPVGPIHKVPQDTEQSSISRSADQPQSVKSPYPANQVPAPPADNTYIIPPTSTPIKSQPDTIETPKNEKPQNLTKVLSSTPANGQPKNAESLIKQHQPPLPTVASLSNHMAQMSNKDKSPESTHTPEVVRRPKANQSEATSPTKKRSSIYDIVGEGDDDTDQTEEKSMTVRPLDVTGNGSPNISNDAKGFIIASETDQADEVEKRKMLFLQNRLKKQEEEKARRASREADMEKKREENRRKQEELEAKKAEEKARREQIRLEYQKRKQQEQQQENEPAPVRRTKSSKPRPKSCMVEDQADFSRPATTRYVDPDDYSVQKKSFTVSAPSAGSSSSLNKAPPFDSQEPVGSAVGAAEKPVSTASPKKQVVPSETSEGAANNKASNVPKAEQKEKSPEPVATRRTAIQASPKAPKVIEAKRPSPQEERLQVKGQAEEVAAGSCAVSVVSQDSNGSGGGGGIATPEYQGPKLYVKPTSKSNRHIITNAISHCVLAGTVNKEHKDKVLEELAKAEAKHFIILFRDAQLQFRALYGYSPESEELYKLYGVGPRHITHKMYENLYKYNSGSKQFSKIPSKTMSVSVDGLTIATSYWLSKKSASKKR